MLLSVLHFIDDSWCPHEIVNRLHEATVPGSYLAISHGTINDDPEAVTAIDAIFRTANSTLAIRPWDVVARFFDGLEMVPPGLVRPSAWRPEGQKPVDEVPGAFFVGVARKPASSRATG